MIEATITARKDPAIITLRTREDELSVSQREVLRVLERAATDDSFIALLTHQGESALQGYRLTWQDQAALLSGDIRWIESQVGKLGPRLRTWLECRLQQEKW